MIRPQVITRPCPCCAGAGCEECDDTGKRWTIASDGFHASGTGDPDTATIDAMVELHAAVLVYLESGNG